MINCPTCGKKLIEKLEFCPRCNTSVKKLFLISDFAEEAFLHGLDSFSKNDLINAAECFETSLLLKKIPEEIILELLLRVKK